MPNVKVLVWELWKCKDFNTEVTESTEKARERDEVETGELKSRKVRICFSPRPSVTLCGLCVKFFLSFAFLSFACRRYSLIPRFTSSLKTMASATSFIDLRRCRLCRWMVR